MSLDKGCQSMHSGFLAQMGGGEVDDDDDDDDDIGREGQVVKKCLTDLKD